MVESRSDNPLYHILILKLISIERPLCLFGLQLLVLVIVLIYLFNTVGCVSHDHVEEAFKSGSMKVLGEIFTVHFTRPQSCEYFIGVVAVLELFVELIGPSSKCDIAIELNQSKSEVADCH